MIRVIGTTLIAVAVLDEGTDDGRAIARYVIADPRHDVLHFGDDLHSGVGVDFPEQEAMASLLDFISAALESRDYEHRTPGATGESSDLFPAEVLEILDADLVAIERIELEDVH